MELICAQQCLRSLAVLCLLAGAARAQQPLLRGMVSDRTTGDKLLGATVRLANSPGAGTATDLDGAFALPGPTAGRPDTLLVSYVGYQPWRLPLTGAPAGPLAVRLTPGAVQTLAQVEVTAKRPIAEDFMVRELNFLQIVTNPAASADPLLAVRTLPAATNTDELASISLRGSDPSQTAIYLNNVPIYDAVKFAQLSGLGTFGIFSVDLVKSVLVFPSNPPLEFGNAGAGLISLSTDEQPRARFLQASLGLANSGVLAGTPVGKRGMLKAYVNGQDGRLLRAVNPASFRQLPRLGLVDGGVHLATKVGEYGTFKAFAYGIAEQYTYRVPNGPPDNQYRYRNRRGFYTLSYEQAWVRADFALAQGLSLRRADDAASNYRTTRRGHDAYAAAHYRRYWTDAFSTRVGLSYDERRLNVNGEFPSSSGSADPTQPPTYTATFGRGRTLWEGYQYTKLRRGPWTTGLGLRLNALPRPAQPGYRSAQLNLRRDLSARQFLNLSGGQYTATTTPEALQFPYLRTRTRQLALDYSYARPGLTVAAAVYAKDEHSVVSARLVGLEAYAERSFGAHFRADVGVAAVRAARLSFDAQDPNAAALARAQRRYNLPFSLKTNLRLAGKWGELGAFAQYRAGAPFTPVLGATTDPATGAVQPQYAATPNAAALPNYFRADISASKFVRRPSKAGSLVLFAVLSNVFNTENVSGYTYSADYQQATPTLFQRRLLYFGLVKTWQQGQ
ncbi:carboxypeptidase-like regulatory domain-containing protein [Hymenobacter sp. IS2118]|uniref:carboxypeptidase-like regulatory domain-containing protein n=1 Tax=Hymenobacter sp. IS2118 TaxID=1505605 RepID=UPI0013767157|nr:carboxypeptidase-like regulatory domain-containing protein [Hymenobacter sp. IS2118]